MTKRLFYSLQGAYEAGVRAHPQEDMKRLGITYYHAVPQTLFDGWDFWCCENVPEDLPEYLTKPKNDDPLAFVGGGLSHDMATLIAKRMQVVKAPLRASLLEEAKKRGLA